jgi:hypothetical protein
MRLWSIHPAYLDTKGLVALWREGLLAKNVLEGNTKGYKNHPQLDRFKNRSNSIALINAYLTYVFYEAKARKYSFDQSKIQITQLDGAIPVTQGQINYELEHLLSKLKNRDFVKYNIIKSNTEMFKCVKNHPLFTPINGDVESWEKNRQER